MKACQLLPALVVWLALCPGCGSGGSSGFGGEVGTYDPDGGLILGSGDASASGALDAHIEQNHMTVTFVTLSCAGPCADVVAVPTGGHAPHTFKWDDGSTSPSRHVCPAASTHYSVQVTDTGTSGELARPAETVQVPLAANVIVCPDGGAAEGGLSGPSGEVCLSNPSFEGTAGITFAQPDVPPWVACDTGAAFANVWNATQFYGIAPSDGATYLRLASDASTDAGVVQASLSEPLCSALTASATHAVKLDVALETQDSSAPGSVEIWGSTASSSYSGLRPPPRPAGKPSVRA